MKTLKLSQFKSIYLGKFPHKYKVYLNNKENQLLFDTLEEQGFFNFYCNNNKQIVSHHCIIAFWFAGGYQAYLNNFTAPAKEINVHHLDGNTLNNSASNLAYVTVDAHSHITRHQRAANKYLKVHKKGRLEFTNQIIWNRKGQLIHNFKKWLANLLLKTIVLTAKDRKLDINIKAISKWFKKIRTAMNIAFDQTLFVSTFFLITETETLLPELQFNG